MKCIASGSLAWCLKRSRIDVEELLKNIYLFIWLHWVLVVTRSLLVAQASLDLLWHAGLVCSMAYGILVPQPGVRSVFPALEGRFQISGQP